MWRTMGKVFLFVIVATIGLFSVLFVANSTQNKASILIPIIPPPIPTPTATPKILPTPTITVKKEATISAEQIIQDMSTRSATLKTTKGDIVLSFHARESPNTVYNFLLKSVNGFYNNLTFHRVEDWVVQGGDPRGDGTGGNSNMPVEFNNKPFVVGSLGSASRGDGKTQNDAQFFIAKTDASWLNGQYTNFGIVKKGIDVVQKLEIGDKILGITIE